MFNEFNVMFLIDIKHVHVLLSIWRPRLVSRDVPLGTPEMSPWQLLLDAKNLNLKPVLGALGREMPRTQVVKEFEGKLNSSGELYDKW